LLECGLLRGSFVPDPVMSRLRDLTRHRKKFAEELGRETQRIQKVLEDAGIKLDSVVSDVLGKGPRNMIEALIAGERDVKVLAEMALTHSLTHSLARGRGSPSSGSHSKAASTSTMP